MNKELMSECLNHSAWSEKPFKTSHYRNILNIDVQIYWNKGYLDDTSSKILISRVLALPLFSCVPLHFHL